jgi:hypothetical protein
MTNGKWKFGLIVAAIGVLTWCSPAGGLEIPAKHHAWGRFRPDSWVRLRESLLSVDADAVETVLSTTVTTTRLERVDDDGVTLVREVRAGEGEPMTTTETLGWDELPRDVERTTRLSLGEVKPGDKTYVCQTHLVKTRDESGASTETKWFYCPDQSPYLLKKIARTDGPAARFVSFEVLEFGVRREVLGQERSAARFSLIENTSQRSSKGSGYLVDDVPGGLVEFEAEIRDRGQQGLLQRRRIELEAFEVAP